MFVTCIYQSQVDLRQVYIQVADGTPYGKFLSMPEAIAMAERLENVVLINGVSFRTRRGFSPVKRMYAAGDVTDRNNMLMKRREYGKDIRRVAIGQIHQDGQNDGQGCTALCQGNGQTAPVQETVDCTAEGNTGNNGKKPRRSNSGNLGICPAIRNVIPAKIVNSDKFKRCFQRERKALRQEIMFCVSPHSWRDLDKCTCITMHNNKGFVAVDGDGSIIALMRSPRFPMKHFAGSALANAIQNGGTKLDCYTKIPGGLGGIYCLYGFIPVCRVKFDPQYADPNWQPEYGYPDVVFFMYCGDPADDLVENYLNCKYPAFEDYDYIPFADEFDSWFKKSGFKTLYEFGWHIRDVVLDKWNSKYRYSFRDKMTKVVKKILGEIK